MENYFETSFRFVAPKNLSIKPKIGIYLKNIYIFFCILTAWFLKHNEIKKLEFQFLIQSQFIPFVQ